MVVNVIEINWICCNLHALTGNNWVQQLTPDAIQIACRKESYEFNVVNKINGSHLYIHTYTHARISTNLHCSWHTIDSHSHVHTLKQFVLSTSSNRRHQSLWATRTHTKTLRRQRYAQRHTRAHSSTLAHTHTLAVCTVYSAVHTHLCFESLTCLFVCLSLCQCFFLLLSCVWIEQSVLIVKWLAVYECEWSVVKHKLEN